MRKAEVEIILKNGKPIIMHCDKCEVVTDAFGRMSRIKYSGDSDTWILFLDGGEVAAVVQRAKGD